MVKTYTLTKQDLLKSSWHACPDCVCIPDEGINLKHTDNGTLTFIVGVNTSGDLQLLCSETMLHTNLLYNYTCKNGKLSDIREGRLWRNEKIVTVWNDLASSDMEVIEYLLREIANINISDYTLITEYDYKHIFSASVKEFEKMGLGMDWNEATWQRIESMASRPEKNNVTSTNHLGFDDKDYMRHFMYAEEKKKIKITQKEINEIVKTIINKIIKD